MEYKKRGNDLVVVAGKEYGTQDHLEIGQQKVQNYWG